MPSDRQSNACCAAGCTVPTSEDYPLCPPHWRMVPSKLQAEVWRHYHPGQLQQNAAWQLAVDAAVEAVFERERANAAKQMPLFGGGS
jgi:hypothetical protein